MRTIFFLSLLMLATALAQLAVLPEFLPARLQLDLGLAVGLAGLAFLPRNTALVFLFALGLQADLLGSERLGLLAFCYLVGAMPLLAVERELVRGGPWGAWLGVVAGSGTAHAAYLLLGPLLGAAAGLSGGVGGVGGVGYRMLSAALFGGLVAFGLCEVLTWTGLLSDEAWTVRRQTRSNPGRRRDSLRV